MRLEISVEADADLADILAFGVGRWGHQVGREYFFSFDSKFVLICDRPLVGAPATRLGSDIRSVRNRQHRIYYEADDQRVLILRVLHVSRDAKRALRRAP